jgi:hypothetical protein
MKAWCGFVLMALFFMNCSANSWTGGAYHTAIVSAVDDLTQKVLMDENAEQRAQSEFANSLQAQRSIIQTIVTMVAGDNNPQPFQPALSTLLGSFLRIDELIERVIRPAQQQLASLRLDCSSLLHKHLNTRNHMNDIIEKIRLLGAELRKMVPGHSKDEQTAAMAHFQLQLKMLVQQSAGLERVAQAITPPEQGESWNQTLAMLESLVGVMQEEARHSNALYNSTVADCHSKEVAINKTLQENFSFLTAAQVALDGTIANFAHSAKQDIEREIQSVDEISREHEQIRSVVKSVLESMRESSEIITPSLCPNSCSGHGMCWSGMCRCDDGWDGVACERH